MHNSLKCFTSGKKIPTSETDGIVSFAVPEYGILFRCQVTATPADLEIIAFLSFLRFVEHNKDVFKKSELQIYCDFPLLVYLMNGGVVDSATGLGSLKTQAQKYTKGIATKVMWIDPGKNRATASIAEIPDMPVNAGIKIKAFPNLDIKAEADKSGGVNLKEM